MIHFKNKNAGFTLIEVLMAIAIVGIVLVPIYALQERMMQRIAKVAGDMHRMFVVYDFFVTTQRPTNEKQTKINKESQDPIMRMSYEQEKASSRSSLQKNFNNLFIEKVSWQWMENGRKKKDSFISVHFEPPEPKPEKKQEESEKKKDSKATSVSQAGTSQKAAPGGKK